MNEYNVPQINRYLCDLVQERNDEIIKVLGQNGSGQNGTDKMVWRKWYTDKMALDKMVWTKWHGPNGTDKIIRIKTSINLPSHFVSSILSNTILSVSHFVHSILSVPFCPLPFCPVTDYSRRIDYL